MATDLAAWLLEQIAEDERVAQAAPDDPAAELMTWIEYYSNPEVEHAEAHIDQHKPSRTLVECETKRRIVELHKPSTETSAAVACIECGPCPDCAWDAEASWPCGTLRLLALPYADRPGYLDEWRPGHDETPPPSRGQGNETA